MKTKEQILTKGLRENLKELMQKEIQNFPKHLETLEPKERLNIICKLLPYVLPKVESVSLTEGEPFSLDW